MKTLKEIYEALVKGNVNKIPIKFEIYIDDELDDWVAVKINSISDVTSLATSSLGYDKTRIKHFVKTIQEAIDDGRIILISPSHGNGSIEWQSYNSEYTHHCGIPMFSRCKSLNKYLKKHQFTLKYWNENNWNC